MTSTKKNIIVVYYGDFRKWNIGFLYMLLQKFSEDMN